ncbi:hypothetical protein DL89DRAFT_256210 [Linderina pennispora]|uniref:Uncharacterized protein n=1 Tax=Linderina pennispora TaxID=61395 RepID=A0A1Y1WCU4_9FUNG|nr:uncharacterized protein DL89DRAFT_256210 [Linderina pennispora]ORX71158.1 hypothetical protein DL89DRAFT_256210 [Linderina pennispora]
MVSLPLEIAELVCQAADRPVLETLGQTDHTWRQLALRELWHTVGDQRVGAQNHSRNHPCAVWTVRADNRVQAAALAQHEQFAGAPAELRRQVQNGDSLRLDIAAVAAGAPGGHWRLAAVQCAARADGHGARLPGPAGGGSGGSVGGLGGNAAHGAAVAPGAEGAACHRGPAGIAAAGGGHGGTACQHWRVRQPIRGRALGADAPDGAVSGRRGCAAAGAAAAGAADAAVAGSAANRCRRCFPPAHQPAAGHFASEGQRPPPAERTHVPSGYSLAEDPGCPWGAQRGGGMPRARAFLDPLVPTPVGAARAPGGACGAARAWPNGKQPVPRAAGPTGPAGWQHH